MAAEIGLLLRGGHDEKMDTQIYFGLSVSTNHMYFNNHHFSYLLPPPFVHNKEKEEKKWGARLNGGVCHHNRRNFFDDTVGRQGYWIHSRFTNVLRKGHFPKPCPLTRGQGFRYLKSIIVRNGIAEKTLTDVIFWYIISPSYTSFLDRGGWCSWKV